MITDTATELNHKCRALPIPRTWSNYIYPTPFTWDKELGTHRWLKAHPIPFELSQRIYRSIVRSLGAFVA